MRKPSRTNSDRSFGPAEGFSVLAIQPRTALSGALRGHVSLLTVFQVTCHNLHHDPLIGEPGVSLEDVGFYVPFSGAVGGASCGMT